VDHYWGGLVDRSISLVGFDECVLYLQPFGCRWFGMEFIDALSAHLPDGILFRLQDLDKMAHVNPQG